MKSYPRPAERLPATLRPQIGALALAAAGALLGVGLLIVAEMSKTKVTVAIAAGMLGLVAFFACGNPRLFCLWGLLLAIPFDLSKRFGPLVSKLGGETSFRAELSDPFWIALLFFVLRDIWRSDEKGLRVPRVLAIWTGIMGIGLGAVFFTPWSLSATQEIVRMLKVALLFVVIANELKRPQRFLHCAAALMVSLIIQAGFGLTEYFAHRNFGLVSLGETSVETTRQLAQDSLQGESVFRIGAFMIHPNIFGIFLATVLPLAIAVFLAEKGRIRWLFALALVVGMPCLIVTYSRSSWVAFAINCVVLFVVMIFHQGLRRRSMRAGGIAALVLAVVCLIFAGPITKRIFSSKAGAMLARAEFEGHAYDMIDARPWLGWGLNSYAFAVLPFSGFNKRYGYGGWVPVTHNGYLLWTAETGVVGLALHLLVILSIMWTAFHNMRVKNELLFAMNAAILAAMFGILVDERFSPSLRANPVLRVFWVLAGIVLAIRYWRYRQAWNDNAENGSEQLHKSSPVSPQ